MSVLATPIRPQSGVGPAGGATLAAIAALAVMMLLGDTIELPRQAPAEPTIEDWRGNSASIRPAP